MSGVTTWTKPAHSKSEIRRAGATLRDARVKPAERQHAIAVANNWRSSHAFPLNTMQMSLRRKAAEVDPYALVAQRVKRLPSIVHKLERFEDMSLDRMQDLGGCRAVLGGIPAVKAVQQKFRDARHKHSLVGEKDYISEPAPSGYRGVHMIYQYRPKQSPAPVTT